VLRTTLGKGVYVTTLLSNVVTLARDQDGSGLATGRPRGHLASGESENEEDP
jgi:hypothetical protein